MPGAGYTSYTRAIQLLRHAEARNQPLHAFYVSDWDDAGENMPVAIARACQYFAGQLGIKADISLEPLALTAGQVQRYELPKAPDKKQTELDALEALHPGELARLLRDAVNARRANQRGNSCRSFIAHTGAATDKTPHVWEHGCTLAATAGRCQGAGRGSGYALHIAVTIISGVDGPSGSVARQPSRSPVGSVPAVTGALVVKSYGVSWVRISPSLLTADPPIT